MLGAERESLPCPIPKLFQIKYLSSTEALRSILVAQQLVGTKEIAVFHHVRTSPRSLVKQRC